MPNIKMPNGDVVAFPDDMPREQIREMIATKFPEVSPQPEAKKPSLMERAKSSVQAFFGGAGQGATMGTSDELAALAQGGDYEANLAQNQAKLAQAQENHGVAYPVGEAAGAIVGALTGVGALSKLAPTAVKTVGKAFGKNTATRTLGAADAGALSGAAYGYGTGVGENEERLENAQTGAVVGGIAGPAGAAVARPLESLAARAARIFQKKPVEQAIQGPVGLSGRPNSQIPALQDFAQMDSVARLPQGAATGNVDMMRAEEMARQGLLGSEHQQLINQVDKQVTGDILDATQAMTKGRADSKEAFGGVLERMKQNYGRQKAVASSLMEKRNRAIASSKLYKDYTQGTLGNAVEELSNSPDFKVGLSYTENQPVRERLDAFKKMVSGDGALDFAEMNAWRQSLNGMKPGTQAGVLAGQMSGLYDDWLENITKDAFKQGDEDLVNKIFTANKNYRQFKEKFGTNAYKGQDSAIERILKQDELTPGQAVNLLFGKDVRGRQGTAQSVGRILSGFTNDQSRQAVKQDIRSGLILRAFENSLKGEEVSLPIFRNNLMNLKNSETYKLHLSDPEYDKVIDGIVKDIGKFTKANSRKDVYSPSGGAIIRGTQTVLDGLGKLTGPAGRMVTENLRNLTSEGAKAKDRRLVEKSVAEFAKQLDQELNKTPRLYGAVGGAVSATPQDSPVITVHPNSGVYGSPPEIELPTQ